MGHHVGQTAHKATAVRPDRAAFVRWVKQMKDEGNHWYIWGAQGQNGTFDCSGLVFAGLLKVGIYSSSSERKNADGLWTTYPHTSNPQPGDLCLYGTKRRATHVTVYIGDGQQIGASGGGRSTTSVARAQRIDAKVKQHSVHYRRDFLGYVRLPFPPD